MARVKFIWLECFMGRSMIVPGALAGLSATTPMTVAMDIVHQNWLPNPNEPIPPAQVAMGVAEKLGVREHMTPRQRETTALLAHYAYGAAVGAIYGSLAPKLPGSPISKGILFGLAVWAASYIGVLPATGVFPPTTREKPYRRAMMIGAHVIWGAATGAIAHHLAHRTLTGSFHRARPKPEVLNANRADTRVSS